MKKNKKAFFKSPSEVKPIIGNDIDSYTRSPKTMSHIGCSAGYIKPSEEKEETDFNSQNYINQKTFEGLKYSETQEQLLYYIQQALIFEGIESVKQKFKIERR